MKGILLDPNDTFLPNYIKAVEYAENIMELLEFSLKEIESFYGSIPAEKHHFRYEDNKWSIAEVLQHIIDSERVISMRAICFARGEKQALPGFDQDLYMQNAQSKLSFYDTLQEFLALRKSNILMFKSFSDEQLERTGTSSGFLRNVKAHAYIIVGHEKHHRKVLTSKYL